MRSSSGHSEDLELALLRRGVVARTEGEERCGRCGRTPLIGERIYIYEDDAVRCELCRGPGEADSVGSYIVHGPEFGHTMKITDRRAA